jgi:uncharacterized protein (TIGR01319 family)
MSAGPKPLKSVLATDCGSTTTKAILIERVGEEYRLVVRGEAPTTVEAPFEDVTRGVLNAIREVEEVADRRILDGERIITPQEGKVGVDLYLSTSSAGGGLQMMVTGVVKSMTGESAERAALGAGAIVMDVIASNDGRLPHQKIQRIRALRPDMILLSGGVDGGTTRHVVELAEMLSAADPKARLGAFYQLPVIFAGNKDARDEVVKILGPKTALTVTDNIRPTMEVENLMPARHVIHDLFMEHVMAQAPGYKKLMSWTPVPIMPTPAAVGMIIETIARERGIDVLGVDIGGATTDVFSVFGGVFNRTVSANLGMSYSISNVLAEATVENVLRWVPMEIDETDLRNRIKNKMIRPTTIPQTLEELMVEQAMCREALRLAMIQHKALAVGLKGVQQTRTISDTFDQTSSGETIVDLRNLALIVGSGGVLSHAPRRQQAMLMMTDAFLPEGVTEMAVDSIFMMPQLGVLSTVHPPAAAEVFEKDCLIRLGTVVAPWGEGKEGQPAFRVRLALPSGEVVREMKVGDLELLPLEMSANAVLEPEKNWDLGAGKGRPVERTLAGGVVGVLLDARGRRPFVLPGDRSKRVAALRRWNAAMGMYPEDLPVGTKT